MLDMGSAITALLFCYFKTFHPNANTFYLILNLILEDIKKLRVTTDYRTISYVSIWECNAAEIIR